MELYTGFDLHANNSYVGIIDADGKREARSGCRMILGRSFSFLSHAKRKLLGLWLNLPTTGTGLWTD